MKTPKTSGAFQNGEGRERATTCRRLAVKAERRAEQTPDPDMRTSFLSMKDLWLDLANEFDRRASEGSAGNRPQ